jgi:hypothetical protein
MVQPNPEVCEQHQAGRNIGQMQPMLDQGRQRKAALNHQQPQQKHNQHEHELIEPRDVARSEPLHEPGLEQALLRFSPQSPALALQPPTPRTALPLNVLQVPIDIVRHSAERVGGNFGR